MVFVGKKKVHFQDNTTYYLQVAYLGVIFNIPITKEKYNDISYQLGQILSEDLFEVDCYQKGYDVVIKLFLK